MGENVILTDLGVIAVASTLAAIVFDRFRFPVILGYVLVGLCLGPFLFNHHLIHDRQNVQSLSELGVIFLLFTLGMEFDLKKLQHLVSTSLVALILQTILMLYIGIHAAPLLGYDRTIGIFLGSLLAISSSMVTIRVLRDQQEEQLPHGQLAIGILILEDILAVLLLVVLSGISATGTLPWSSALWSTFLLGIFVVVVFYLGRIIMPFIIKIVHKIGSLELVTLFAVGTVLGIGVLAEQLHLSLGLGAFVAGSLFTNSSLSREIENSIAPLKELFSSVFFVSTGMLIDPHIMLEHGGVILLLALCVIVGKTASCTVGLFLAGQKGRRAFKASLAKSQIGEFSFVIAKLAEHMGLADEKLVSIAVGVSFLTILSTPIVSRNSTSLFEKTLTFTPSTIKQFAEVYHRIYCSTQTLLERSAFIKLMKRPFWQMVVSFFLVNGMIIGASLALRLLLKNNQFQASYQIIGSGVWVITAILTSPFLISIYRNISAISLILVDLISKGSTAMQQMSKPVKGLITQTLSMLLIFIVSTTFITSLSNFLPTGYTLALFILLILIIAWSFNRQMILLNSDLENRFINSFHTESKHLETGRRMEALKKFYQEFDWNSLTTEKKIEKNSKTTGQQIAELGIREKTGATIIAISRGEETIYDPNPLTHLFKGDRLMLLGDESQLAKAIHLLDAPRAEQQQEEASGSALHTDAIYIEPESLLEGNTLAGCELRNKHRITAIGIKHGDNPVSAPDPTFVLQAGDLLLIVGKRKHVETFKKNVYSNDNDLPLADK